MSLISASASTAVNRASTYRSNETTAGEKLSKPDSREMIDHPPAAGALAEVRPTLLPQLAEHSCPNPPIIFLVTVSRRIVQPDGVTPQLVFEGLARGDKGQLGMPAQRVALAGSAECLGSAHAFRREASHLYRSKPT
jgi:hypothetical protein